MRAEYACGAPGGPPYHRGVESTPSRLRRAAALLLLGLALAGCASFPQRWQAEATATAVTIRAGRTVVEAGSASAAAQAGRLAASCPQQSSACASASTFDRPFGDRVQARAGGPEGPVAASGEPRLPAAAERILTLEVTPATAQAAAVTASARTGDVRLDLTPARGLVEGLPLRGTLDALSRRLAEAPGPVGRLDDLTALLDSVGGAAAASVTVGAGEARALDVDGAPRAVAAGGLVRVTVAEGLPGGPDGLVELTVHPGRADAGAPDGTAGASGEPPRIVLRWLDLVSGEYVERTVDAGDGACAGPEPLRLCVAQDPGASTSDGTRARAAVGATSITLFDDPLPQLSIEVGPVEAAVDLAPDPAGQAPTALALLAVAAVAAVTVLAARETPPGDRAGADPPEPH
jgi:hypothetical protein